MPCTVPVRLLAAPSIAGLVPGAAVRSRRLDTILLHRAVGVGHALAADTYTTSCTARLSNGSVLSSRQVGIRLIPCTPCARMPTTEEALVNAVYHRSYAIREPIEVRITPGELVVLSYPGPDRSVRLEQLRAGRAVPRRYRNRRMGELLKELGLTEGRATGIPKILRAMRDNGSPPPAFETDDDYSYFLVRLPVHPAAVHTTFPQETTEVTTEVATEVARLLPLCTVPRSRQDLQRHLALRNSEHFRKAYLVPALASGLLEMTIPAKPKSRLQQYRLTPQGRRWLVVQTGDQPVS